MLQNDGCCVMTETLLASLRVAFTLFVVFFTPFVLARSIFPTLAAASLAAAACMFSIALNVLVPAAMHAVGIPFTSSSLAMWHGSVLALALVTVWGRRLRVIPDDLSVLRWPALLCLGGIVLVIPFTPLAGIDTYKWQDLATAVQVEGRMPWLVHPAGLFGFTPRAYPCAQPLLLASVQSIGGVRLEAGFFIVSCLSIITSIFASFRLGSAFLSSRGALWFAALYTFAPVAIRYHHWATGRGFFLAVLPLFVLGVLGRTWRHALLAAGASILMLLSHKTAVVAIPVLALGLGFAPGLRRSFRIPLALAGVAVALLVAGNGLIPSPGGIVTATRLAVTRFGVLAPLFAVAVLMPDTWTDNPPRALRRLPAFRVLTLLVLLLPIAFTSDMYGTLLLLPLAALAAAQGLAGIESHWPHRSRLTGPATAALLALGAFVIVGYRNLDATPHRIRDAALFLDAHDPAGPFRIVAPDRVQGRMQAYVRGCPRFNVVRAAALPPSENSPVSFASPREFVSGLTARLRDIAEPPDLATDWYGQVRTVYYVVVDDKGADSPEGKLLYDRDGVRILRVERSPGDDERK